MVVTRSMSGTTKKTDTKIADEREERIVRFSKNSNIMVTRAKSGATKKVPKVVERPNKESFKCGYRTIKDDAFCIFMIKDYLQRYYEANPPYPTKGLIPDEVRHPGILEWTNMSDSEKTQWIELAKKLKDEGLSIFNWRRINNI